MIILLRVIRMLVGYLCVSSADDRQVFDLQRDALLTAGMDARHLDGSINGVSWAGCSLVGLAERLSTTCGNDGRSPKRAGRGGS